MSHGKSHQDQEGQRFFFDVESRAGSQPSANGQATSKRSASSRRDGRAADTLAVAELLKEELGRIHGRLDEIQQLLCSLSDRSPSPEVIKEFYTTKEVARILGRKRYTVCEWCRLGRVNAKKTHAGRGQDDEWRISHVELVRIQNEGLLPLKKFVAVRTPDRLK